MSEIAFVGRNTKVSDFPLKGEPLEEIWESVVIFSQFIIQCLKRPASGR